VPAGLLSLSLLVGSGATGYLTRVLNVPEEHTEQTLLRFLARCKH
jgi:hypothetical protein